MALNFPDSPTLNQVYTDSTSGFSYQWNGTVWISFSPSTTSNISELDDISASFNGSTTIFALTVNGIAVSPASTNQLLISVGGVMQNPTNDYYISGSNIIFTTAPTSGLTFFGILLGTAVPIGVSTIGDVYNRQTYAVTGVQTNFTFTTGYTVGYLDVFRNGSRLISGDDFTATNGSTFSLSPAAQNGDDVEAIGYKVSTIAVTEGNLTNLLVNQNARVLGITTLGANVAAGQTALLVQGNARVTGILTVGSGSVTINGTTDRITVGTGLTLSSDGITAGVVTATSIIGNSANITGVVTATTFVGSGSGLTGIITSVNPVGQTTTSQAGTTTINLSLGNVIFFNHNTNTTVAFANTATTQEITFIRNKDDSITPRLITWSSSIKWNNDTTPVLTSIPNKILLNDAQIFKFITRDAGVTWYGYQEYSYYTGGQLLAWGANGNGQLGLGDVTPRSSPVQIPGTGWSSISGGGTHSLATKTDGTLWSWGNGGLGALGQNNRTEYSLPIQVAGTTWNSIASGQRHSLATKTDGTLWSWGYNVQGPLGQNNRTQFSSPVQIPGTTWSSVGSGTDHSFATKTDGTLWAWGTNASGQMGQSTVTPFSSPVQIPGTTWSSIVSSSYCNYALATKTDGTLWSWGQNYNGQLGQNNRTYRSSPIQIPGTTWSSIAGGTTHSLATKTDGTLWAWGQNGNGQLGQNNRTYASSPVQVPGTTWSSIAGGQYYTLATKTDGTLWSWGYNNGRLGQNNTTQYSSPVQIPGTIWSPASGISHSLGILITN